MNALYLTVGITGIGVLLVATELLIASPIFGMSGGLLLAVVLPIGLGICGAVTLIGRDRSW